MRLIFVETRPFGIRRKSRLNDEEYRSLQEMLLVAPESGAVIPGCGGLRKVRFGETARGRGKRGGIRIVYLHIPQAQRIDLITIYSKGEREDLSADDKRALRHLAAEARKEAIRQMWTRKRR
jgi:hypothetical protein